MLMSPNSELNTDIELIDKNSEIYNHFKPLITAFPIQIFLNRVKFAELKITLGAAILLAEHVAVPGKAVMYAYYLYSKLTPGTLITADVFSTKLFPWGMFSEEQLDEIWDLQKVDSKTMPENTCFGAHDNLLDYLQTWGK